MQLSMSDKECKDFMHSQGYTDIRNVNGMWCAISRFMFTYGLLIDIEEVGYSRRFCFDTHLNASLYLKEWNGKDTPTIGLDGCTAIK